MSGHNRTHVNMEDLPSMSGHNRTHVNMEDLPSMLDKMYYLNTVLILHVIYE